MTESKIRIYITSDNTIDQSLSGTLAAVLDNFPPEIEKFADF